MTNKYIYHADSEEEITAKLFAIADHFGVEFGNVSVDIEEDAEAFKINFYGSEKWTITLECVHVASATFKDDMGSSIPRLFDFSKLMGNNYYYFRLM